MPSPRQIWWARFRVVVVCAVATVILTILFYLLTGGKLLAPRVTLYLYIPDATGVGPGAPVRVDGIDVGKVSDVRLSGSNQPNRIVRVAMRVERARLPNITLDSTADLASGTLLGDMYIEIQSGRSPNHVGPGDELLLKPQATALDLQQFAQGLGAVDSTLRDIEEGRSPLGQFVVGEEMYQTLMHRLGQIEAGLRSLENTTSQMGGILYSDQMYRNIEAPILALDQSLAAIQAGQGALGQLLRDSSQYDQLQAAFADIRHSVANMRSGTLLQSDDLYNHWNRSLRSLVTSVDAINANPMFTSSETYDNLNGFAREIQTTVDEFRKNPQKFLRLQLF